MHVLPVLHDRLEYADLVRAAFDRLAPDGVVVEIPSALESRWLQALDRLPAISVLLYENRHGQTIYLPLHPADPMVEAARRARAAGMPLACGDLDVDGYGDYADPAPDSYAAVRLGPEPVYRAFAGRRRTPDPLDDARESAMAFHAQRLRKAGAATVLAVCGMHHARGLAAKLAERHTVPLTRPRRENLRLVHLHPESLGEVLPEIPFHVAAFERRREGLPAVPDRSPPSAVGREVGPFRVLSGGGADETRRLDEALDLAAVEAGWSSWESWAHGEPCGGGEDGASGPGPLDRVRLQWSLLREAERALAAAAPDERVEPWQRDNLARFSRNLARVSGRLVVDLLDLLVAARGCVSENFAWEAHRVALTYPWQVDTAAGLPTARIRADDMYEGVRRIRLAQRRARRKRAAWDRLTRRRRGERFPGEWLEGFDSDAICSYPPEDEIVENFGRFLKQRGKRILSEERSRTVPFTTSVLDGIDVRETIRHWHEKKIYVRELGRVPGGIGSVVVIFDEDDEGDELFPHCQTWLGEHDQESDMAFYSTEPGRGIVGPGICRATYGGFLLSYPPRRMVDVWGDPDYRVAERKSEVLMLAALDYSEEPIVVFAAARPPRSIFQQLAGRLGLKILYVPLGTLSPATLRKIRVMHVLSGRDKRRIARDYVW